MNIKNRKNLLNQVRFKLSSLSRLFELYPKTKAFSTNKKNTIKRIYVINLDRKPHRWRQISKELKRIFINKSNTLFSITRRFSAIDARYLDEKIDSKLLKTKYSLADQLAVEPNDKISDQLDTQALQIDMTPQEIAIALSHIEIWKLISESNIDYTLILEDDIYFKYGFNKEVDRIWNQLTKYQNEEFDILYLSYEYVKGNKNDTSRVINDQVVSKPVKGVWHASGYILSKEGARKMLEMLPVYGPVDLWLNLVFDKLNVYIANDSIISQRLDVPSTNSYSIMPIFSKLGIYTGNDVSTFNAPKLKTPVFVFGEPDSGQTSLANALMILGYTCCYNLDQLPKFEEETFWDKKSQNLFNAYVNISSLSSLQKEEITRIYPEAKFIYTSRKGNSEANVYKGNMLSLSKDCSDKWEKLCKFLHMEYPSVPFPEFEDSDVFELIPYKKRNFKAQELKFDKLPWIISNLKHIGVQTKDHNNSYNKILSLNKETKFELNKWRLRDDTFPSNLSLFNPNNIKNIDNKVLELNFKREENSVRSFTSAALVTKEKYLFGKFSVELRPSNVSGLITGIFLHRNSPHQEIDIEFLGKDTTKMLINVFFNPGIEGSKMEYGYRGTPVIIDLGFDAHKEFHLYEIHWLNNSIKWYVDGDLVYERGIWEPTPIPYLPMDFNVNLWHSQSKELAGSLNKDAIPAKSIVKSMKINY
ncbi:hypothetical protein GCM10007216_19900 [Thalassobacillus devorans]|uniref:Beta-glucanase n=1 Tax=Thalassobacillus devorans TaxID=279813 RepID=A0ABQ1P4F2_9BACI|nr:family 16 glycosylhydrolase [Thalassobacillus devorans]NIK28066.1 GR25 family glycosyltransferase involved in LPS biosynthesis [Thalassobacillus devorans]GGC89143.1 hypothetical protein GCM10007216_19900 [Thalassobacillus devorans]